jgi:hypothetical protein
MKVIKRIRGAHGGLGIKRELRWDNMLRLRNCVFLVDNYVQPLRARK